jgi:hypothetical protein
MGLAKQTLSFKFILDITNLMSLLIVIPNTNKGTNLINILQFQGSFWNHGNVLMKD